MRTIGYGKSTGTTAIRRWLRRHAIIAGFFLAYAFTWSIAVPAALEAHGLLRTRVPKGLLTFANNLAPGIAAILLLALTDGRAGLRELGRRLCKWRVSISNYLLALGIPAICVCASLIFFRWIGGALPPLGNGLLFPVYVLVLFFFAPLWEEICWRGFILPRLQQRWSPLIASLLLGIGWGLWHVPYYLGAGTQGDKNYLFLPALLVGVLPLTVLLTWIYNRTGGSLLLVVIFHSALDASFAFFYAPLPSGELRPFLIYVGLIALLAVIVVVKAGVQLGRKKEQSL